MFVAKWKRKPKSSCYSSIRLGEYLTNNWTSTKNLQNAALYFSERDMRGQLRDEGIPVNKYFILTPVILKER